MCRVWETHVVRPIHRGGLWGSHSRDAATRSLFEKKRFPKGDARSKMGRSLMERGKAFKDDLLDDDV